MFGKNWTKSVKWGFLVVFLSLCVVIIRSSTIADTVYHNDGREIKGIAKKAGDKVIVTLPGGQKLTFAATDILYIAKGPIDMTAPAQPAESKTGKPAENKPAATDTPKEPTTKRAGEEPPVSFDDSDDKPRVRTTFSSAMNLGSIDPAQTLYEYLRKRPSGPGSAGPGVEELIKTARVRIHDRERKVGLNWLKPEDFIRRREAFEQRIAEAEEIHKQYRKIKPKSEAQQRQKNALMEQCRKKLLEAAKNFADPLLRRFIMGVANYNTEDYNRAVQLFSRCTKDAPIIAGFYQGLGNSLIENKVYEHAINCLLKAFMLTDDPSTAIAELRQALQRSPGTLIQSQAMKNAKRFMTRFSYIKPRKLSTKRQYWLMPGRTTCRIGLIPELDYDRLDIKQGAAIPITESRLIVGKDIVKDADYVVVRLTNWLYLPAKVEKLGSNVEMVILYIPDVHFNPMQISKSKPFKKGEYYNAIATDIFPSMSSEIITREIIIKSSYGLAPSFEGGLLPGQGTAPLINSAGNLVGFLSGKLKTDTDDFKDRIIPVNTSSKFLRRVKRDDSNKRGRQSRNRIRVPGHSFIVFAIGTETFTE